MTRRTQFGNGEFYHVYNRGVDRRSIFSDNLDVNRFMNSLGAFNQKEPVGSLYEESFRKNARQPEALVKILAYCLNPNHYHILLQQQLENGVSEFMKRLGGGYTWYFNNRHNRNGALFQGKFKAVHVDQGAELVRLSAYINLNDRVHQLGGPTAKLVRSSWRAYGSAYGSARSKEHTERGDTDPVVGPISPVDHPILGQFESRKDYARFAEGVVREVVAERKVSVGRQKVDMA